MISSSILRTAVVPILQKKYIERVQRRITKMIPRLRNVPYEGRLKKLFSLSKWRMRGYLIEVFNMFKGFSNINAKNFFTVDQSIQQEDETVSR